MSDRTYTVFISDVAYQKLIDEAMAAGYIQSSNTYNANGLSEYIAELVTAPKMCDNRPADIRAADTDYLEVNLCPEWQRYMPRRRRRIKASSSTLVWAATHAYTLGMVSGPLQQYTDAPSVEDGPACLGRLLEAYGTGWVIAHGTERTG